MPSANAIFFNGDRVEGSGNPVIERLSDIKKIAEVLVSKFVGTINVWVVEAPQFNGPFAVYKEFIPALNCCGEPKAYTPCGFLASVSTFSLLSNCLKEAKNAIAELQEKEYAAMPSTSDVGSPTTFVLGFSKGGIVLNQLLTELSYSEVITHGISPQTREESLGSENLDTKEDDGIIPNSKESLLNSITEIHYVDVGLNSAGAYLTDTNVFKRISRRLAEGAPGIRFVLHGTPRQWCDKRRAWIQKEKNKLVELLQSEAHGSGGKLRVSEKYYFPDRPPTLQMHFEIINDLDVS